MKVMIVDDHPVMREGFSALLRGAGPGTIVLQARNVADALALVECHVDLDILIMDLFMPGVGGLTAITRISRLRPDLPLIVLSSSEDPKDVRKALSLGALGYVPKSASSQSLLSAIKLVMNGDIYVPPLRPERSEFRFQFGSAHRQIRRFLAYKPPDRRPATDRGRTAK